MYYFLTIMRRTIKFLPIVALILLGTVSCGKDDGQNGANENNTKYQYVDLGLSVKWATCNVGAQTPEEYGDFFAWAETEPYYETGHADSIMSYLKEGKSRGYYWPSYKYSNASGDSIYKYNINETVGQADSKTVLEGADDVAHVKWGGKWRIPTADEFIELFSSENCDKEFVTQKNGVKGYLITSKKPGFEGASIFLPAAGFCEEKNYGYVGSYGAYWCSTLDDQYSRYADYLVFVSSTFEQNSSYRYLGLSVRPVWK